MKTSMRLFAVLALGFALAACGGDDDGNGNGGGGSGGGGGNPSECDGVDARLHGSCSYDFSCVEYRGADWPAGSGTPQEDCEDPAGPGVWSTSPCPASSKAGGGCAVEVFGTYAVTYWSDASEIGINEQGCTMAGGCFIE